MVTNDYKPKKKITQCEYIKPKYSIRCKNNAIYGMSYCYSHISKRKQIKDDLKLVGVIKR